ncbi:MAG TPA: type II toxin-antitoxin system CcdA family antitoxin [Acetobacteraceae bacterium]|nr:type II toxin-antitoxin system CcdA family antitoxin [Acetobacteraceae bacterium]
MRKTFPARQAVNLSLDADLVRRARAVTPNLSGTVEGLLAGYVASEEAKRQAEYEASLRVVQALARFREEHGSLADDFSPI